MTTVKLYKFKDSITRKIPFLREGNTLLLNELSGIDISTIEKFTEYTIMVSDDFNFENCDKEKLIGLCNNSEFSLDYYFVTSLNDY